jgi:hypothetical protein
VTRESAKRAHLRKSTRACAEWRQPIRRRLRMGLR